MVGYRWRITDQSDNCDTETMDDKQRKRKQFIHRKETMGDIQRKRKQLIHQVCAAIKPGDNNYHRPEERRGLLYINKYQIAYCQIPKVGITNWKRIILVLMGYNSTVGINHHVINLRGFPSISKDESRKRHCTSFLFVRHPFQRLLSAYRNKFEIPDYYDIAEEIGRKIVSHLRPNASASVKNSWKNVTFPEFIQFLLYISNKNRYNWHWDFQHKLCEVCEFSYDFIGHFENIVEESNYLLRSIGITDVSFPEFSTHATNSSNINMYLKYFAQVPGEDIIKLYKLYEMDFKLFGYPFPEELIKE
ncbi:carbohydrate sulfotransferase 11-like [Saccoglossus kowalevskii]